MGIHYGYRPVGNSAIPTNFNYVSLLLKNNGTNTSQNNTFLDGSTNNFTITRSGNTTQGSFSPYGSLWSNYFDSSGDYLTVASNAAFALGTENFTIEGWIFVTVGSQIQFMVSASNTSYWAFGLNASNQVIFRPETSTTNEQAGTTALALNTWHHIAAVREGTGTNQFKIYLNGVLEKTGTVSTNYSASDGINIASGRTAGSNVFSGYVSNLRILKGTAVYTGNFTPPTAPLTAISGTSLLTCQSNRFRDASTNNFTITRTGDVRVTEESPFVSNDAYNASTIGGSGYFDGTGDYLTLAHSASYPTGTVTATFEAWFYTTATGVNQCVFSKTSSSAINFAFYIDTANTLYFATQTGGSLTGPTIIPFTWYHIAVSTTGGTATMYINGTQYTSGSVTIGSVSNSFYIGALDPANGSFTFPWCGYISDVRIVNGSQIYTGNFTPPTAPLTAVANTVVLANFTNAGIYDAAGKNNVETVGNAQVSTSVKKYSAGSIAFDGTGDYLRIPDETSLYFGSGDFTIELWANFAASVSGSSYIFVMQGTNAFNSNAGFAFARHDSNKLRFIFTDDGNGASGYKIVDSTNNFLPTTSTWYHLAATRSGSTIRLFIDGVLAATGTYSQAIFNSTQSITIGADANGAGTFNGYIEDLRIFKGYARYTADFTPPIISLPTRIVGY